jgi:dTDP-D-glucose 4,6-dehydratase
MEFVLDNVVGTCNILEFARTQNNLERFIYFSTDEVFGPAPNGIKYQENDRYNSTNPYSATKAGGEELAVAYENTYGLPVYITHCHDTKTKAWTENGFKNVEELTLGENVWVLKDNKELALEPILEIVNSPYSGDMIEFKSTKYDLFVTPNHRMLTRYRNEDSFRIETAESIFNDKNRHHIPLSGEWNGSECDSIDLTLYKEFIEEHFNSKKVNLSEIDVFSFMSYLGWYLSEGFTRNDLSGEVTISQKKYDISNMMDEISNQFGIEYKSSEREDGVISHSFYSVILSKFMSKNFGTDSHNKRIPSWVKNMSKENLEVLFESLMKGDGSNTNSYMRYYTAAYDLAVDVSEIGIKLGYSVSIKSRETYNPSKTKKSTSFYVSFRKSTGGVDSHNKNKKYYEGNIWCVRTLSGNFFVERNGIISCSGNTMNVFGERQHPEKYIPMCIRRVRDREMITIHSDSTRTIPGSRHYIHAEDVSSAVLFLLNYSGSFEPTWGGAKCPKFNIVGAEELNNLELAQIIADAQGKELKYELVDFHSSRPGHDLRYALDGDKMKQLGWVPAKSVRERIAEVANWTLENERWITL